MADMFVPSYATVSGLVEGDTIARQAGVQVGDFIVAVNGAGFRRFAPDYPASELENLTKSLEEVTLSDDAVVSKKVGDNYAALLAKIKEIKSSEAPLFLSLERHGWDARAHSWSRFLKARDNDVPAAMMMIQNHEAWKTKTFPIDLTAPGVQSLLKLKAVSEVDVTEIPTVYVNYGKLQSLESEVKPEEVVQTFVIFTEMMLQRAPDPRCPKTCQFIDLSGVSITQGFRVDILKQIYAAFEPNYPETLHKMVMYPVSKTVVRPWLCILCCGYIYIYCHLLYSHSIKGIYIENALEFCQ
jgi:hypothetical protein